MAPQPIPMRRELLLDASPAQLWPLVSNTNRFNRALGLPAAKVEGEAPGEYAALVSARLFGLRLTWREPPFEWVEGRYFRAVRDFDSGPIARFEGGVELRPEAGGTRAVVDYTFTPRNGLGAFLVRHAAGKRAVEDAEALLRRFERSLKDGGDAFPARRTKSKPHAAALAQKAQALHAAGVDAAVAAKLLHLVEHGYDDELGRMRPFELADAWGFERLPTLRVFLHATRAGLLDMSWTILCPNCAGGARLSSLADMKGTAHCGGCRIEYGVDFDRSVELRFSVSPTIRKVETRMFCVGSPARTPFAAAQLVLRPGPARELEVELGSESFVLRDLERKRALTLRPAAGGPSRLSVDVAAMSGEARFAPGRVTLSLTPAADAGLLRLERESWREKGATAALVTSLQDFRDLFSSEVLAPGVEIAVRTVALLFTDLKGSTALYEQVGDAAAYSIVRDHFGYLFDIVRKRDGAVVKTIGDAVMAVFARPADAVEAALEMQERVGELNAGLSPKPSVVLKIGVHAGPSIAINADGVLDYFGTTVNVAARVQNVSEGGDVVITDALAQEKTVSERIAAHGARQEPRRAALKGLSSEFHLRRLLPRAHG